LSVIPYVLAGLAVVVGTLAFYFGYGGTSPGTPEEWASFGTYAGGVAGPLLSFIALIAVAHTISLQRAMLEQDRARQLADQHLRWLDALYRDMTEAVGWQVSPDHPLRDVLDGVIAASEVEEKRLKAGLDNLMRLLSQYCQAVDLYRDNISEFYDLRIYADRGARFLDAIKPFHGILGTMFQPTIEFCDMHLRGDAERATPQALTRSSRAL